MIKIGIGQDSHRFVENDCSKPLVLGGITIPHALGLSGNSDADVLLHALTNGISGVTTVNILGGEADTLCLEKGITDSSVYLKKALEYLVNYHITHVSFTIEALRPKLLPHISAIRKNIAELLALPYESVAITATTGEGLTDFGKGEGIQAFVVVTAQKNSL